ncbi:ABC-type transport auxiliary lipoprotein family protein [Acetobacter farinalis]|uniref:ABC-type transport auxiliary lipoprotein family protein n=1 Tax=Acetobacter farinalis TaxID=1260984 RepID=A0ABT3Q8H4_9PROT|nr:PqiC family protein [Acetobacter farinalis]MCX2561580.1 ABC-type transport auxiliary lipoprotein family protein [Acetobacter farinalis]
MMLTMMLPLRRLSCVTLLAGCALLASCASPPLRIYTLSMPSDQPMQPAPLSAHTPTIGISLTVLPDYLDSQDIVVRNGEVIVRSPNARWASRLSLGITDLITSQIAHQRPQDLVTDQPLAETPSLRVQVNIARLDVNASGSATLDANWAVLPLDPHKPLTQDRVHLSETGDVSTESGVVTLMRKLILTLADRVNQSIPAQY